jgi:hypothetical protein
MFFPDKIRANQEARRVLRTNGHYLLVTFNRLELNPIAKAVEDAVSALFAHDPFDYMERGPISTPIRGRLGTICLPLASPMWRSRRSNCQAA